MSHVPQALQTDDDDLVEIIVDFLVAFTHQVLYYRSLYPASIFERRRLYNIAVQRARHPDLCSYIQNAIDGLKMTIRSNSLEKFGISILSSSGALLERFFVRLKILAEDGAQGEAQKETGVEKLEAEFRGTLQKLQHIRGVLLDVPDDVVWKIVVYIKGGEGEDRTLDNWVLDQTVVELPQTECHGEPGQIIPIKSVHIEDLLTTHVYVEHYSQ